MSEHAVIVVDLPVYVDHWDGKVVTGSFVVDHILAVEDLDKSSEEWSDRTRRKLCRLVIGPTYPVMKSEPSWYGDGLLRYLIASSREDVVRAITDGWPVSVSEERSYRYGTGDLRYVRIFDDDPGYHDESSGIGGAP